MTLWNIIHGAEFWLAVTIFCLGACWGLLMMYLIWWHWGEKK